MDREKDVFILNVNGKDYECTKDKKLIRFLRDDLRLTSVKDGCSQGACGTCSIVIDGKSTRACIPTTSKCVGKTIITTEGLSEKEKEAFAYAFGRCGSVQCGYCIPGMVMSGKALIDQNPEPTFEDAKKAIRSNFCRCTGYVKIIEGIVMAAKILRGEEQIKPLQDDDIVVGSDITRIDAYEKTLGTGLYPDDIYIDGMYHGSCVRTKYPRAKVLSIDISKALECEGVVDVLTAKDVPNNKVGHIQQDWDVFIAEGDITRSFGDAICLVVAETPEALEKGKKLVKIEYEKLEPVTDIFEALKEDAPKVHSSGNLCQTRKVSRGDAKTALENCAYKVSGRFSTPFTEHAFMETECAVAYPYKDGVKVITTDQGVYDTRKEIAIMFGWDPERIVVENALIGGGFGGKEDVSVQHLVCLAAVKLNHTVKIKMSREESLAFHPKRHKMVGDFTIGCDENGIFQGMEADIYFDTGAYASLAGPVLERACTHAVGPYTYQNTDIRGYGVYTNNTPAGAFRGFGVCQSNFAMEALITKLGYECGLDPWEIRYRNAIEPGKVLPNGQIADRSTALKETLEAVKDVYYEKKERAGISCAMKNSGVGVGLPDKGRCRLVVNDGDVEIYSAASCLGQGLGTVLIQIACQTLDLPEHKIKHMGSNSELAPDSGTSSGSRQTLLTGEAAKEACRLLRKDIDEMGLENLEGQEYFYEYFEPTDPLVSDKEFPKSHIAYGYATHVCVLDEDGLVEEVYAAHDSGKIVNPIACSGQVDGGVIMGLGYVLTEDWKIVDGVPPQKFGTIGLWKSTDIPQKIETIFCEKNELLDVAYGAKGIGEIATIPIAPAAQGAYYELDGDFRQDLPLRDTAYSKPKKSFR